MGVEREKCKCMVQKISATKKEKRLAAKTFMIVWCFALNNNKLDYLSVINLIIIKVT